MILFFTGLVFGEGSKASFKRFIVYWVKFGI